MAKVFNTDQIESILTRVRDSIGSGSIVILNHQKIGTVHQLTGIVDQDGIVPAIFIATDDFSVGDTFTIDDIPYTIQMNDGTLPSNNMFVSVDTVVIIIDITEKIVTFKHIVDGGNGYIKDDMIAAENLEYGGITYGSNIGALMLFSKEPVNGFYAYPCQYSCVKSTGFSGDIYRIRKDGTFFTSSRGGGNSSNTVTITKKAITGSVISDVYLKTLTHDNTIYASEDPDEPDVLYLVSTTQGVSKYNLDTDKIVWNVPVSAFGTSGLNVFYTLTGMSEGVNWFFTCAQIGSTTKLLKIYKSSGEYEDFTSSDPTYGICVDGSGDAYLLQVYSNSPRLLKVSAETMASKKIITEKIGDGLGDHFGSISISEGNYIYTFREDNNDRETYTVYDTDLNSLFQVMVQTNNSGGHFCPIEFEEGHGLCVTLYSSFSGGGSSWIPGIVYDDGSSWKSSGIGSNQILYNRYTRSIYAYNAARVFKLVDIDYSFKVLEVSK